MKTPVHDGQVFFLIVRIISQYYAITGFHGIITVRIRLLSSGDS